MNEENNPKIGSENIFDEFSESSTLVQEVEKLKKEKNKDLFFYITKIGGILQTFFLLGVILTMFIFGYIYIQNNEKISDSNLLDPFCPIFLGNIKYDTTYCSSIATLKIIYDKRLENLKQEQTLDILKILEKLYKLKNFTKSKEVIFLRDKSENKLHVLSILEKFDDLKNKFDVDKEKISCQNIQIDSKKSILSMNCLSFTNGYEKGLKGFDGTNNQLLKGTSLSQANSFLNYIEKTSQYFNLIDRQKMFKEESLLGTKTGFTSKTQFSLKLHYNLIK